MEEEFFNLNKASWNKRTETHFHSSFYDVPGFIAGKSTLNSIELELLGNVLGKKILHLQCHFGQDTLSLARLGAEVTGVDFSENSIVTARKLAKETHLEATFICCNIYDLPTLLNEEFDIVYTSYGTIGWLPDLDKWAQIIAQFLKKDGQFIFVEFHPVVWMFDDDFTKVQYNYFNKGVIIEEENGTYADRSAEISSRYCWWNHSLGEVFNSLLKNDLSIAAFNEYDYSPYNCFMHTKEFDHSKFRIQHIDDKIPMVYSIKALK